MPKGIFHPLDYFIFAQIDKLKTSAAYQQIVDLTSGLSDFQQKIINQIITGIALMIPILFVLGFFYSNLQLRQEVNDKKEILRLINEYGKKQGQLGTLGRTILAPSPISSKADMDSKVRSVLSSEGIKSNKVSVKSFETSSPAASISLATANITFNKLSTRDLSALLQGLIYKERAKIAGLKINRNKKTEFLDGELDLVHYGKAPVATTNDKKN